MTRFSRRQLAQYASERLAKGDQLVIAKLAAYLVESGRTKEADLLVCDIEEALAGNGVVVAHVASAHILSDESRQQITKLLQARFGAAKTVLSESVEPNLLGGVRIAAAGEEFDGSLRRKINQLKNA